MPNGKPTATVRTRAQASEGSEGAPQSSETKNRQQLQPTHDRGARNLITEAAGCRRPEIRESPRPRPRRESVEEACSRRRSQVGEGAEPEGGQMNGPQTRLRLVRPRAAHRNDRRRHVARDLPNVLQARVREGCGMIDPHVTALEYAKAVFQAVDFQVGNTGLSDEQVDRVFSVVYGR